MEAEEDFDAFMARLNYIIAGSLPTDSNVGSDAGDLGSSFKAWSEVPVTNTNRETLETLDTQLWRDEPSPDSLGPFPFDQLITLGGSDFMMDYDMTMLDVPSTNGISDMVQTSQPLDNPIAGSSTSPQAAYPTPISLQLFPLSPTGIPGQTPAELPAGANISPLHLEGSLFQTMGEFQQPRRRPYRLADILPFHEVAQLPSPTEQSPGLPYDGSSLFPDPEGYQPASRTQQSARRRTPRGKGPDGMAM